LQTILHLQGHITASDLEKIDTIMRACTVVRFHGDIDVSALEDSASTNPASKDAAQTGGVAVEGATASHDPSEDPQTAGHSNGNGSGSASGGAMGAAAGGVASAATGTASDVFGFMKDTCVQLVKTTSQGISDGEDLHTSMCTHVRCATSTRL
jgi:hypothetical protein